MAAHQAPLSLGFSRQEHWSGLPLPSPMHESEKWKWSHSVVSLSDPMDCSLPGSSVHGIFPGRSTGVGCHSLLLHPKLCLRDSSGYVCREAEFWLQLCCPVGVLISPLVYMGVCAENIDEQTAALWLTTITEQVSSWTVRKKNGSNQPITFYHVLLPIWHDWCYGELLRWHSRDLV